MCQPTSVRSWREATNWLTGKGVRVVGTDAWSWDAPFSATAKRFADNQDPTIVWEGHKAWIDTTSSVPPQYPLGAP